MRYFLLWLVFPFMVALSFYGNFRRREKICKNTRYKFFAIISSALLLKDIPMGCRDTVLPEPLLKNHNLNCLTFERNTRQPYIDNLCLFRAVALHLFGNERLEEETSKIFKLFLNNSEKGDVLKFQGVQLNDIPKVEHLLQLNIFLYDIDFVDGVEEVFKSMKTVSSFYATTFTFATSTTTHCLKLSGVLRVTHFSRRRGTWNDIWLLVVIV